MRFKISSLLIILTMLSAPFVFAEGTAGDYMYGITTKFGRGLENVVTSFAEIPCTIHANIKDQGGTGVFSGFGKGTLFMLRRMLVGVTEVGTFFIPMERTIPRVCHETEPAVA